MQSRNVILKVVNSKKFDWSAAAVRHRENPAENRVDLEARVVS
jgi:hypothetical protein